MKANLKTNKKEYKKRLKKYILDILKESYKEYYNKSRATEKQALQHFMNRFDKEFNYPYNIRQYPNIIDRMENYLLCLPFSFPYMYYDIIKDVAKLHKVDVKTITEEQKDTIGQTYFNKLSMWIVFRIGMLQNKSLI